MYVKKKINVERIIGHMMMVSGDLGLLYFIGLI